MLQGELFAFLERTGDAAFTVTDAGEIRSWNRSAERLFGYQASEVLSRQCHEVLRGHGPLGIHVCAGDRRIQLCAAQSDVVDFDLHVRKRSGERLWVNVSTLVFDDSRCGERLIVHLARDISARKNSEELLRKMVDLSRQVLSTASRTEGATPVSPLSEQERRILRLFADAKSSAEIGRELGITLPTLRNHLHSINEKLGTHNRLEAVMHALRRGLI